MEGLTIRPPEQDELHALSQLRWQWVLENGDKPATTRDDFAEGFVRWVGQNRSSHRPLIMLRGAEIIGMAWLAIVPRVPTPHAIERSSGDVQCVYVIPDERDGGHGGQPIEARKQLVRELGLEKVTVHSSERAIAAYHRHGFDTSPRLLQAEVAPRRAEMARNPARPS